MVESLVEFEQVSCCHPSQKQNKTSNEGSQQETAPSW